MDTKFVKRFLLEVAVLLLLLILFFSRAHAGDLNGVLATQGGIDVGIAFGALMVLIGFVALISLCVAGFRADRRRANKY